MTTHDPILQHIYDYAQLVAIENQSASRWTTARCRRDLAKAMMSIIEDRWREEDRKSNLTYKPDRAKKERTDHE